MTLKKLRRKKYLCPICINDFYTCHGAFIMGSQVCDDSEMDVTDRNKIIKCDQYKKTKLRKGK